MPSYRNYIRSAEMAEVVTLANSLATSQIVFYNTQGRWASFGNDSDKLATMGTTDDTAFGNGDNIVRARTTNTGPNGDGIVFVQIVGDLIGLTGNRWIRLDLVDTGTTITKEFCATSGSGGTSTPPEAFEYLPCN